MEETLKVLIGEYGWMAVAGMVALLFKEGIVNAVEGFMVFVGNDYNADDVVLLNGKPARIVRMGPFTTVFYMYKVTNGKITHGNKMAVRNSRLKSLSLEKPLSELNLKSFKEEK